MKLDHITGRPWGLTSDESSAAVKRIGCITLAYAIAGQAIRLALRRWGPAEFKKASSSNQHRTTLYVLSTINCCLTIVPYARYIGTFLRTFGNVCPGPYASVTRFGETRIVGPVARPDGEAHFPEGVAQRLYWDATIVNELITGYLIHDLIAILPEARKYPADIFHHVTGIICGLSSSTHMKRIFPYIAPFFSAEFSTIFLNLVWAFREYPQTMANVFPGSLGPLVRDRLAPLTFAAAFGSIRAFLYPYMLHRLFTAPVEPGSNTLDQAIGKPGRWSLFSIQLLQWYWFVLIVKKVIRGLSKKPAAAAAAATAAASS